MCEGRRGPIGVQEETEATGEGSDGGDGGGGVIWSRLKPEQEGLVTEAYLWRRHRGSETVALWEDLLQQTCCRGDGEKFEEEGGQERRRGTETSRCSLIFSSCHKCTSVEIYWHPTFSVAGMLKSPTRDLASALSPLTRTSNHTRSQKRPSAPFWLKSQLSHSFIHNKKMAHKKQITGKDLCPLWCWSV